jgi:hypothetical protein
LQLHKASRPQRRHGETALLCRCLVGGGSGGGDPGSSSSSSSSSLRRSSALRFRVVRLTGGVAAVVEVAAALAFVEVDLAR